MTRTVSTGIAGLDYVLGGGLRLVERLSGVPQSGSLLIRGGAGVGKTVLAAQIAIEVAHALGGDVVYGCVELLPIELDAQIAGLHLEHLGPRVLPPFDPVPPRSDKPRLFASLLDLGEDGPSPERLGGALSKLLGDVKQVGGQPRVLVIDSLSSGYRLGGDAPRPLIDAIVKLAAEQGVLLILVEETIEEKQSGWVFAVDTAIQLAPQMPEFLSSAFSGLPIPSSAPIERPLAIVKHRLAASDAGPHFYRINKAGVRVFPRLAAYMREWIPPELATSAALPKEALPWGIPALDGTEGFPKLASSITAVCGYPPGLVHSAGFKLGGLEEDDSSATLLVYFGAALDGEVGVDRLLILRAGDPFLTGYRLASNILQVIAGQSIKGRKIRRAVFTDFAQLRNHPHESELRQTAWIFGKWLNYAGIATILIESGPPSEVPLIANHAEVVISINGTATDNAVVRTHLWFYVQTITVPWWANRS
jgi:KaiC/GvpD/RAD55 family RecA-like ATPase